MKKNKTEKRHDCKAGDLVEHTTQDFGRGRVMEVKDGIATISFKKGGKKNFPSGSRFLVPATKEEKPVESTVESTVESDVESDVVEVNEEAETQPNP